MSMMFSTTGTLKNFLTDKVKEPIKKAIANVCSPESNVLVLHKYNSPPAFRPSPISSKSQADAELDAYADVSANLVKDETYSGHGSMQLKKEFREEYGDKTSFVTLTDSSKHHISELRAHKKRR